MWSFTSTTWGFSCEGEHSTMPSTAWEKLYKSFVRQRDEGQWDIATWSENHGRESWGGRFSGGALRPSGCFNQSPGRPDPEPRHFPHFYWQGHVAEGEGNLGGLQVHYKLPVRLHLTAKPSMELVKVDQCQYARLRAMTYSNKQSFSRSFARLLSHTPEKKNIAPRVPAISGGCPYKEAPSSDVGL